MKRLRALCFSRSQWTAIGVLASSATLSVAVTVPNTFTAGTPARAEEINANFNALKDAVNALQSGASSVSNLGFVNPRDGDVGCQLVRGERGAYYIGSATSCAAGAAISLPHGVTVTGFHCTVYDNAAGNGQILASGLSRTNLGTGETESVFSTAGSLGNGGLQRLSDTGPESGTELVDNEKYTYFLATFFEAAVGDFSAINNSLRLYGCSVTYKR